MSSLTSRLVLLAFACSLAGLAQEFRGTLLGRVTDPSGAQIGLVANRAADYAATSAAGLYLVQGTLASGEDWKAWVGVNAGALEESDLRAPAQPDFVQGRDQAAGNKSDGLELWPLLAALAALVLIAEAWVAWR